MATQKRKGELLDWGVCGGSSLGFTMSWGFEIPNSTPLRLESLRGGTQPSTAENQNHE